MTDDDPARDKPAAITALLAKAREGDQEAVSKVWTALFKEVHVIARRQMAHERTTPTLQPSLLVNEVFLRLFQGQVPDFESRTHFIRTVSRSMTRFLIDRSRIRRAMKRGAGRGAVSLSIVAGELADLQTAETAAGADALDALEALENVLPDAAEVARLRFVLGLSVEQTADVTGMAPRTVKKKWALAKAWMRNHLDPENTHQTDLP